MKINNNTKPLSFIYTKQYVVYKDLGEDGAWFYGLYNNQHDADEAITFLNNNHIHAGKCSPEGAVEIGIKNLPKSIQ